MPASDCAVEGCAGEVIGGLLRSQHNPRMTRAMFSSTLLVALASMAIAAGLAACSPTLNWREIQPEGSELFAMFPCKPDRFARSVPLAGSRVEMRMSSCVADGATYAVAYASVADPAQVSAAITELRAAAAGNIAGVATEMGPVSVPGMTPNPSARRVALKGRGTDGAPLQEQAVFFVKGLRVYQASIVGPRVDAEAADTFVTGLRIAS